MARSTVKLNSAGMKALLNSGEVRDLLTSKAEPVLEAAVASAPYASGEYMNGLQIVQATTDRAVVRVTSTAPHSWIVEARQGILSRALDAAG